VASCPECGSDDLDLVEDLGDGTKQVRCMACSHEWVRRGEARYVYRDPNAFDSVRARFPSVLDVSEPARTRAEELKRSFLASTPQPDPRVAHRWAQLRVLFSDDELDHTPAAEFKHFANENLGANPGNMSVFNNAWNEMGPEEGARQVREVLRYLLYTDDGSHIEDRLTRLITGGKSFGMTGFREALLTKVLCVMYPDRFLPIVMYTGDGGKKEVAASVYNLIGPERRAPTLGPRIHPQMCQKSRFSAITTGTPWRMRIRVPPVSARYSTSTKLAA